MGMLFFISGLNCVRGSLVNFWVMSRILCIQACECMNGLHNRFRGLANTGTVDVIEWLNTKHSAGECTVSRTWQLPSSNLSVEHEPSQNGTAAKGGVS